MAVALTPGYNGDGGTIFASYGGSQDPKDPVGPPMAAITPEQYNRICPSAATRHHTEADVRHRYRVSEG